MAGPPDDTFSPPPVDAPTSAATPPSPLSLYHPPPPPQSGVGVPSTLGKSSSPNTAVGVGVAVGAVVLLGLAAVLIFCLVSRRRRRRRELLPGSADDFYNRRQRTTPSQLLSHGQEVAIKNLHAGSGQGHREFRAELDIMSRVQQVNNIRNDPKNDPYGMPKCIQKLKMLGLTPSEQYKVINHLKEDTLNRQTFMEVEADVLDEIIKVVVQAQVPRL